MYSTWSVNCLKEELIKRNASVAGKKAALIERLEAYDRNNIIGVIEELEDDIVHIPALENFRDVNASTKLPNLTRIHIQEFAERFQVQAKGKLLYENRNLLSLRIAEDGDAFYFHAQCLAQMKKVTYIVTMKFDFSGMIEESHCECAAGSGLEAHCKHIFTVLYAIEDMVRTKTIIMHKVCTEKLMMFNKPKNLFYGSPIKAQNIPTRKRKCTNYLPLEEEEIMDNYEDYVKNMAVGFPSNVKNMARGFPSKMPYVQTVKPANPYALEWDHGYAKKSSRDILLENLLLKNVTKQQLEDVQIKTVLQDACTDWHEFRSVRVTASNFHAVGHSKDSTCKVLANNILYPKKFTSRATTHGKVQEPVALNYYETHLNLKIEKCGLYISSTHPFLAASPDGILGSETLVEVKCPFVARHCHISPNTVPYLYEYDGELKLKEKHNYYTQIQGQLFCTNRKYCNLLVYTFVDMKVIYIKRDDRFIQGMLPKLTSFYENFLQPEIFNKYLYKNYQNMM